MEFLQVVTQTTQISQTVNGLLFGAVCILGGVVVTLALYIRKLHNKHSAAILSNTKEVVTVCLTVTNALENNTKAIDDIHGFIIHSAQK